MLKLIVSLSLVITFVFNGQSWERISNKFMLDGGIRVIFL